MRWNTQWWVRGRVCAHVVEAALPAGVCVVLCLLTTPFRRRWSCAFVTFCADAP